MNNASLTRRSMFRTFIMPALAVALVGSIGVPVAQANTPTYNQGYAAGKILGRKHGYTDGYTGAYKASYQDEIINGTARTFGYGPNDYVIGYKAGYSRGYKSGYRSGTYAGDNDGRQDAQNWKDNLRDQMRHCMETNSCSY